jgi:hypothetical protein
MKLTAFATILSLSILVFAGPAAAGPEGTKFTYQGRLIYAGQVADEEYDFQFRLFDADVAGTQLGTDLDQPEVDVIDGYFTVQLDFGGVFDGNERWLQIGVRPGDQNDPCEYIVLSPRQKIMPTPYALYALNGSNVSLWQVNGSDIYYNNGNVGIGTTRPEKKLDIAGAGYTDLGISLTNNSPGGTSWDIDNDGGVLKIVEHASCAPEFMNNPTIAVVGNCIGSPYGGNVGIGTTSPLEKLHIDGNLGFTEKGGTRIIRVEKSNGVDERGCDLEIHAGECNAQIIETLSGGDLKLYGGRGEGIAGGNVYIYGGDHGSGTSPVGDVILAHNGTDAGGNVGIGTANPARNLHVSDVMRLQPRDSAPPDPAEGDIYMDGTTHKLMVYDGTAWQACW